MSRSKKLSYSFYRGNTIKVAKGLLGHILVHRLRKGVALKGKIVETEAYLGLKDPCCHSFHGKKTGRVQVMYKAGGVAYVYIIYGLHICFNVVTEKSERPEAVLIRAIEPLEGIYKMRKNRNISFASSAANGKRIHDVHLANGPAKLCQALGINRQHNGIDLTADTLYIEKGTSAAGKIRSSARIGMPKNREASLWLLRFYIKENPYVSHISKKNNGSG